MEQDVHNILSWSDGDIVLLVCGGKPVDLYCLSSTGEACLAAQLMCLRALWSKLGDGRGQQGEESRSVLRDALRSSNEEVQWNQAAVALTPVQSVLFLSGVGFTCICDTNSMLPHSGESDCLWDAV